MKKDLILFALIVFGSAAASETKIANLILSKGEILLSSVDGNEHYMTISYKNQIYVCVVNRSHYACFAPKLSNASK